MQPGGATFGWDLNGNLTSDGFTTFAYDTQNRLTGASGAKTATLTYDPMGRLYQVSNTAGTTRFLYDGDRLISEYSTTGVVQRRYVHGVNVDEPMVWYEGSAVSSATRRYQYTGQTAIQQVGLYYYKARFYNPALGQFMQTDPTGRESASIREQEKDQRAFLSGKVTKDQMRQNDTARAGGVIAGAAAATVAVAAVQVLCRASQRC